MICTLQKRRGLRNSGFIFTTSAPSVIIDTTYLRMLRTAEGVRIYEISLKNH